MNQVMHPQRAFLVAVVVGDLPDHDVVVPELLDHRDVAVLDRLEQAIGDVGDGVGVDGWHGVSVTA